MTGSDVLFGDARTTTPSAATATTGSRAAPARTASSATTAWCPPAATAPWASRWNGIAGLLDRDPDTRYSDGNVLNEVISTPGSIQTAVINKSGRTQEDHRPGAVQL